MKIRGFLHLYIGEEAVAVGAMEALTPEDTYSVRLVFAKNKKEAENLLRTPRKPSTPVEEWEG